MRARDGFTLLELVVVLLLIALLVAVLAPLCCQTVTREETRDSK